MRNFRSIAAGAGAAAALLAGLQAAARAASIVSDVADGQVNGDASHTIANTSSTSANSVVGPFGDGTPAQIELPFQLPDLGAVANPFTSATLSVTGGHNGDQYAANSLDLSGLTATRAAPDLASADYGAAATPLQGGLLTDGSGPGTYTTSGTGSANLLAFLNAQYAGGANAGQYVFLTLTNNNGNSFHWFTIDTRESGGATAPTIAYAAASVPEPAAAATTTTLAAAAGLLGARHRRSRRA